MPTLAKLQAAYAGKPVEVVTVSIDSTEFDGQKAPLFIAQQCAAEVLPRPRDEDAVR